MPSDNDFTSYDRAVPRPQPIRLAATIQAGTPVIRARIRVIPPQRKRRIIWSLVAQCLIEASKWGRMFLENLIFNMRAIKPDSTPKWGRY